MAANCLRVNFSPSGSFGFVGSFLSSPNASEYSCSDMQKTLDASHGVLNVFFWTGR
jgi:hypothetical protein